MVNHSPRLWDPYSVIMLLVCIWLPAALLQSTGWAAGLDQAELLALLGAALGLVLGRSKLSSGLANFIFLILSLCVPLWLFMVRMTPEGDWIVRLSSLGQRARLALMQAVAGQAVQDPLIFVVFCAYFFWVIGYFTGFGFTRRWNPWQGLLAAAGIFGVIDFYAKTSSITIWLGGALILLLFLLASRLFWLNRKMTLESDGFVVERDASESISRLAAVLGLLLVIFAWNLETIIRSFTPGTTEYERVSEFWQNIQMNLQNNFVALQGTTSLTGTYPGGMELGNQTPDDPSPAFLAEIISEPAAASRFYWRVKSFYEYRGGQWQAPPAHDNNDSVIRPDEYVESSLLGRLSVRYFWQSADGSVIPYPGRFSSMDIPYRLVTDKKPATISGDVQLYPLDMIKEGDMFYLESAVFTGTQKDLQSIRYFVPGEIVSNSLQIPESVPARVKELAKEIAIGETVAERVSNVTRYLRSHYTYKNQIASPPRGRDPVDWFLFDKKEGFCTYFATAEVILLRAAGIPARMAVGYSPGERLENTVLVRLNEAHTWPEVYFPEIGWLPFEPTVNEAEPAYSSAPETGQDVNDDLTQEERRGNIGEIPQTENVPKPPESQVAPEFPVKWLILSLIALLLILSVTGLWLIFRKRLHLRLPRLPQIFIRLLKILHIPIPRWLTWWNWYTSLSPLAVKYYWIERISLITGYIQVHPATPADLLAVLAVKLPSSREDILLFENGLYRELYSQTQEYAWAECNEAGVSLQRSIISGFFDRLLHRVSPT